MKGATSPLPVTLIENQLKLLCRPLPLYKSAAHYFLDITEEVVLYADAWENQGIIALWIFSRSFSI